MLNIFIHVSVFAITAYWWTPAKAHEWYPHDCCHGGLPSAGIERPSYACLYATELIRGNGHNLRIHATQHVLKW
jgi:hypothetical protein